MGDISGDELEKLMSKYKDKLDVNLSSAKKEVDEFNLARKNNESTDFQPQKFISQEYEDFKQEYVQKKMNLYEKACKISEKYINYKPSEVVSKKLEKAIDTCHLNITPTGAYSFPFLAFLALILGGMVFGYVMPFVITTALGMEQFTSLFFVFFAVIIGTILIVPLQKVPFFLANDWKMKASNQMVLSVFYIVTYMRHTSNLELAIDFASEHLSPPLSLDFKRVVWNIETGKFESIKDSLDDYLEGWKETNMEFVESIHLIMSSLYESSEERRVAALDKALEVILDETYEKMLKYAHELKSPMTMITMLGVILPILTLVIAPLAINFMGGIEWWHLAAFYNVALPFGVYYLSKIALSTRPGGGAQIDIAEDPERKKSSDVKLDFIMKGTSLTAKNAAIIMGVILFLIAISPQIIHFIDPEPSWDPIYRIDQSDEKAIYFLEYKPVEKASGNKVMTGPFGLGASVISVFIPLSLALSFGFYFKQKSKAVKEIRDRVKTLETEFSSALFQLGNRLGDGLPAEIAFEKVAELMDNTVTGNFFKDVSNKISKLGMSIEMAVFDPKIGVLKDYPSNLIESSMKVLSQSSKKGPKIASQAIINVANYIKEMHRVDERVKDLMGEVLSSVKGQISFLAPSLTGIVVGITSMIGSILGKISNINVDGSEAGGSMTLLDSMFKSGIPTYYFQAVVGVYVVQLVYVLTVMANEIENGKDKDGERFSLGINLSKSTLLYSTITIIVMLLFNIIGLKILGDM
ncbi:hypothetical protein C0585_00795 [Candidatus Woesearchaeota archaeon]|nr:MAG: hypothetical protein C0585_00795 [Candidatus Woesearchaeota archaeon]